MEPDRHFNLAEELLLIKFFWVTFSFVHLTKENQKGVNAVHRCSIENQKGAIVVDFVQQ